MIRWLTVFIDLPADRFDRGVRFWGAVTGWNLSATRGDDGEFATLVPPAGTPILKVQRVGEDQPRLHLDLHVDDVAAAADAAEDLGATVVHRDEHVVLTSPAGMVHCLVAHLAGTERPDPFASAAGSALVDQLAVDVPAEQFAEEVGYWSALTAWPAHSSTLHPELTILDRAPGMPWRLLVHRLGEDDERPLASAHLDLAAGEDRDALAEEHGRLGAGIVRTTPAWVTMVDPAGLPYCLTRRHPSTGSA